MGGNAAHVEHRATFFVGGQRGQKYLAGEMRGGEIAVDHLLHELISLADIEVSIEVDPQRLRLLETKRILGSYEKIHEHTGWIPQISLRQSLADSLDEWMHYWAK